MDCRIRLIYIIGFIFSFSFGYFWYIYTKKHVHSFIYKNSNNDHLGCEWKWILRNNYKCYSLGSYVQIYPENFACGFFGLRDTLRAQNQIGLMVLRWWKIWLIVWRWMDITHFGTDSTGRHLLIWTFHCFLANPTKFHLERGNQIHLSHFIEIFFAFLIWSIIQCAYSNAI